MKRWAVTMAAVVALSAPAARADAPAAEVEAFMRAYLTLWNAGDAAAISSRVYRFEAPNPWQQEAGLKAEFDRLKADGYLRSDVTGLEGCMITRDRAVVELRYIRVKTDGGFMPPKDRLSLYFLRKFPDGWRVTSFIAASPSMNLNCKSAQ